MSNKWHFSSLILLTAIVVAIGLSHFFWLPKNNFPLTKPWIEVINPQVFAGNQELKSGDQLELAIEVKTTASGRADIHFSDGSVARLEPNTSLIIKDSYFDQENKTSITKIFLNFGEIISQVTKLATPESLWEVKTANAVAVVRGTKYSVKFDREKSLIKVFEGSVLVAVIDARTGAIIEGTAVMIGASQSTEIGPGNIDLKKKPEVFEAVLIFSDDTRRVVTDEVEWELSDEEKGVINAVWRHPVTGEELRGQTTR